MAASSSLRIPISSLKIQNPGSLLISHFPKSRSFLPQNPRNFRVLSCSSPCLNAHQELSPKRWESFRKKKVVMRVGYVGTDYREATRCCQLVKSFDARRECTIRMYSYLLPAEVIGIKSDSSTGEIESHLSEFNDILKSFEGDLAFHNYTVCSKYWQGFPGTRHFIKRSRLHQDKMASAVVDSDEEAAAVQCEEHLNTAHNSYADQHEYNPNGNQRDESKS